MLKDSGREKPLAYTHDSSRGGGVRAVKLACFRKKGDSRQKGFGDAILGAFAMQRLVFTFHMTTTQHMAPSSHHCNQGLRVGLDDTSPQSVRHSPV